MVKTKDHNQEKETTLAISASKNKNDCGFSPKKLIVKYRHFKIGF